MRKEGRANGATAPLVGWSRGLNATFPPKRNLKVGKPLARLCSRRDDDDDSHCC